jgi:hypothetical protein
MKPIAWYDPTNGTVSTDKDSPLFTPLGQVLPLYTKQEQEPVGQLQEDAFGRGQVMWFNKPTDQSMLYTTPPQRTWVGLTKEERHEISMANRPYCANIMAAHEEELKRRNA